MNCCGIPFNVCYSLLLMAFLMFPSRLGGSFWMVLFLFCLPALEVLPVWKIIVYHYGWKVREKLISSSYSRGGILVIYQAIKSWDTAYLGGALLDAAITGVEAVYLLATPLFLFLPWILYDVIAKWLGLPAVISINCL